MTSQAAECTQLADASHPNVLTGVRWAVGKHMPDRRALICPESYVF
jgi:hypothetical protein